MTVKSAKNKRENLEGKIFPVEGKTRRITENFPVREKVGKTPIFSLGKKKYIYYVYINDSVPYGH